jgi:predicted metalloendopeptidase
LETKFLDRAADPCVDFYQYACGNWNKLNPIPPDQARWDVYGKLTDENQRYLWGILDEAAKADASRTPVEQKIGDYFSACMDEAAVEKAGAAPLQPRLRQIAALKSVKDIPALLANIHLEAGDDTLFAFTSSQDYADSSRVIAFALSGGLGLPDRDYYVNPDAKSQQIRTQYLDHVAAMLALLGDSPDAARAGAQTVMAIETDLAKSTLTRVERRDPYKQFHKLTRSQIMALTPDFNWDAYWAGLGLPAPATLNVTEPAFFKELEQQLKTRPIADWKTYMRWHVAHSAAPYLSQPFVQASFDFYSKTLRGVTAMRPRWKRCVSYVDRDLGEALGQAFVAKTFTPATKAATLAMTNEIEAAMQGELEHLDWMSEATKKQALIKLHGVLNKIGYPDKWRDYSRLEIRRDDLVGNIRRASAFEIDRQLGKLGKPVDKLEWHMTPQTVNAYYNSGMNEIVFPAAILQPPFFDLEADDAVNYGGIGAVIGHEIGHGFDDQGSKYDGDGNMNDWWTDSDRKEFDKRTKMLIEQYNGVEPKLLPGHHVNGALTVGENIGDLGGLTIAYKAYTIALNGSEPPVLDNLTGPQRLFVGWAQVWRTKARDAEAIRRLAVDPHSPPEFRCNGVARNLVEFYDAFGVKEGDKLWLPPEQRVRIW